MQDNFDKIKIMHKNLLSEFESENLDSIIDEIDLGEYVIVFFKENNEDEGLSHNVSVGIASSITAYSRIHMSYFKNNPEFNLYYSDTDSAYMDRPLPTNMVSSTTLGKMKLENILTSAIFIAPKVYYLITEMGELIYKVKGLSHDIELTFNNFEELLYKESFIKKLQIKWIKNLEEGNISVRKQLYTLKVTDNKRKLVYNENNKLIGTIPYTINESKEILNK